MLKILRYVLFLLVLLIAGAAGVLIVEYPVAAGIGIFCAVLVSLVIGYLGR